MLNKKFLLCAILTAAVCLTACSKGGTGGSENITVTTAEAESIDTSDVEYMKEALQADWNDPFGIELYAADLNGDGIKELFVNYSFDASTNGLVYIYDVSDGMKKLYEISARMWSEKSELYKDENGTVHLIHKEGYA
ncbi:MAG: hypothetical protein K2K44_08485, partial [Oscillospiraceae bacterium]|nr:hypothetical protein [Oscillospiraceae bacterium]